jgi:Tol biopolymer transport system component
MTQAQFDRVEARMPELLGELAAARVPDYFDDMLGQTGRARQRPAWSLLERWIPVDITAQPARAGLPGFRTVALAALLLLAVMAAAFIYAGSTQTRLPPPFGPAGNGSLYYANADGDIFAMDPQTFTPRSIISGHHGYASPVPSKDGRLLAFLQGTRVFVANSDGTNIHPLLGEYVGIADFDWSPDSDAVGITSSVKGTSALTILAADGSAARTVDLADLRVHNAWFLPDGRVLFEGTQRVGSTDTWAIYVMKTDGSGLHPIVKPSASEGDYIEPWPSPDGKSVLYHVWREPDEHGALYTTEIATGATHLVDVTRIADENYESAQYSPDGSHVLFSRFPGCCRTLAVAPLTGGQPRNIGEMIQGNSGPTANAFFSPDGKFVIAWYPDSKKLWLLDPTGAKTDREIVLDVPGVPTWQRVAAP